MTNQNIIRYTKRGVRALIIHAIEDTWTRRLKDADKFYLCVTPLALLELLTKNGRGLKCSDTITLLIRLP